MDPTTYDPCDGCGLDMPDYERAASELTTKTGHAGCMAAVDEFTGRALEIVEEALGVRERPHLRAVPAPVTFLTDYAMDRQRRLREAKQRHPAYLANPEHPIHREDDKQ
jgi:hypothetical protein